jgi:outer membrane receptor for ferrienterochelin and colicin
MKKTLAATCLSVALALSTFTSIYAQHDPVKLDELSLKDLLNVKITTASKTSEESDMAAASVIVITAEQIKIRGYQSLLDVLQDIPDMKVDDKLYTLALNNFTMRGIPGQDKFILLLDGVPISSPTNEAMPIFENYPVNLAEQIEVVYGPGSALYGANAVSGVINIITKKDPSRKNILLEASSSAGTYGQTNSTMFLTKRLSDNAVLVVSGQYFYDQQPDYTKLYGKEDSLFSPASLRTGTFNTPYGPITPVAPVSPHYGAPMSAYNLYASLHVDSFSVSVFSNYSRTPSTFGNNTNNNVYNADVYAAQRLTMASASYKKSFGRISSTSTLMTSEYILEPRSDVRTTPSDLEPSYLFSTGSTTKLEEQLDWRTNEKLNFTGGASYATYNSIPDAGGLDEPVNLNNSIHGVYQGTDSYYLPGGLPAVFHIIHYTDIGTYLQAQYSVADKISFTFGVRYDVNSDYGNIANPRLGLVYKPFDKTTIKALYGSSFLAPSPADTYLQYGSFDTSDSGRTYHSNFLHLPNPGLKPITSHNSELNIRQYLSDNLSITVDGYYTQLMNLHANANDNNSTHLYNNRFAGASVDYIEVTVNQGKQVSYGGSMQINYKSTIGRVKLNSYASLSYTNGRVIPISGHPAQPEFISPYIIHLGTDLTCGRFTCSPRLTLMGRQNLTGFSDTTAAVMKRQTIAGYALLTVSLRYALTRRYACFVNINNALNQNYRSVGPNMDLDNKQTETFYGQHEDPIRILGGFNFNF